MAEILLSLLKADLLEARKKKNTLAANFYRTLIGKADPDGKGADNEAVIKAMKSMKNDLVEKIIPNVSGEAKENAEKELAILNTHLPAPVSVEQYDLAIFKIVEENGYSKKEMGKIISELKTLFGERHDGKLASTRINAYFA